MNRAFLATVALIFVIAVIGGVSILLMERGRTPSPPAPATSTPVSETEATTSAIRFEIADTPAKQELGLGRRASIPDNYGMLFVFPQDGNPGFWMKDMLVPIDIIWMDSTGTIVKVDASVSPSTYPNVLNAPVPVRYVLETRAGYAAAHGWRVGTRVPLPAPYGS